MKSDLEKYNIGVLEICLSFESWNLEKINLKFEGVEL